MKRNIFLNLKKLNWDNSDLRNSIDNIEIIPNKDKGTKSENYVLLGESYFDSEGVIRKRGLQEKIFQKIYYPTNKNLFLNKVENGYYKLQGGILDGNRVDSYIEVINFKKHKRNKSRCCFKII